MFDLQSVFASCCAVKYSISSFNFQLPCSLLNRFRFSKISFVFFVHSVIYQLFLNQEPCFWSAKKNFKMISYDIPAVPRSLRDV